MAGVLADRPRDAAEEIYSGGVLFLASGSCRAVPSVTGPPVFIGQQVAVLIMWDNKSAAEEMSASKIYERVL